jgi:hypothetical protein
MPGRFPGLVVRKLQERHWRGLVASQTKPRHTHSLRWVTPTMNVDTLPQVVRDASWETGNPGESRLACAFGIGGFAPKVEHCSARVSTGFSGPCHNSMMVV